MVNSYVEKRSACLSLDSGSLNVKNPVTDEPVRRSPKYSTANNAYGRRRQPNRVLTDSGIEAVSIQAPSAHCNEHNVPAHARSAKSMVQRRGVSCRTPQSCTHLLAAVIGALSGALDAIVPTRRLGRGRSWFARWAIRWRGCQQLQPPPVLRMDLSLDTRVVSHVIGAVPVGFADVRGAGLIGEVDRHVE